MLLIILAIWFGYKKARDTGRNPFLWAAISGGIFIGVQLLVGVGFGILIGMGQALWGWSESAFEKYQLFAAIPAIILSIGALMLVFRFLDKVPEEPVATEPPPPQTFGQNE
jgi:hypothetical protein